MCEQHQALEVEREIEVRYPRSIKGQSLALPSLPAMIEETAGRAAVAIEPVMAGGAAVGAETSAMEPVMAGVAAVKAETSAVRAKPVAEPQMSAATEPPNYFKRRVKKPRPEVDHSYEQVEQEDPRKAEFIALAKRLQDSCGQGLSGKKLLQSQYVVVQQLADFLGIQLPFNSDRNYEKSDGFRRNQISRICAEAKKLLGEEADAGLPAFFRE